MLKWQDKPTLLHAPLKPEPAMPSRFIRCEMVRTEAGSSVVGFAVYIARTRREDHSGMIFNFAHRAEELAASGAGRRAGRSPGT